MLFVKGLYKITMKKYMELQYGEFAPEVIMQPPFENPKIIDDALRMRLNREGEAAICAEFSRIAAYPEMMRVKVKREGRLRVYRADCPAQAVLLFCHGGSFCFNSLEVYDYVMRYLAAFHNLVCVSVEYRLAPEHPFPQGLEDCYGALQWASEMLAKPEKLPLCVAGDSSGGNFAAVLCRMACEKEGPEINAQALFYPVLDLADTREGSFERYKTGYFLEADALRYTYDLYRNGTDAENPYLSPLRADRFIGLPPAVILSAECDILVDDGLEYAQKLKEAGVEVEYILYKGMPHGFLVHTYHQTFEALDAVGEFCKRRNRL